MAIPRLGSDPIPRDTRPVGGRLLAFLLTGSSAIPTYWSAVSIASRSTFAAANIAGGSNNQVPPLSQAILLQVYQRWQTGQDNKVRQGVSIEPKAKLTGFRQRGSVHLSGHRSTGKLPLRTDPGCSSGHYSTRRCGRGSRTLCTVLHRRPLLLVRLQV
jgi:hypothetical protein